MDDVEAQQGVGPRAAERAHAAHRLATATSFAPLVAMGNDILKAVSLINGGAGIATLFFAAELIRVRPDMAGALVWPLAAFGFGLTVAGCATGWSYFSHEQHARALGLKALTWSEPFVVDNDASRAAASQGERYRRLALGAVFTSIASVVVGFGAAGATMLLLLR